MDTRRRGNWNTGHEWSFYPTLTDDQRYAIIEFLKSYTSEPPNIRARRQQQRTRSSP